MGNKRRFMDKLRLYVKGGLGGYGLSQYGGIGGRGGHVYLKGCKDFHLKNIEQKNNEKRFIASNGKDSSRLGLQGAVGEDYVIKCPLGITVLTDNQVTLGEMKNDGQMLMVARGGMGGEERTSFIGQKGHQLSINLDLKLIADVGFVGFPNAGKSTLLKCLSRATPKIASYPFTTIEPNIGTMVFKDERQISLADLPGLIEGAHRNVGMGHKFLKHLERTKVILMIVDAMGFRLKPDSPLRTPFENIVLLNRELELYKKDLLDKPCMLVINKVDIPGTAGRVGHVLKALEDYPGSCSNLGADFKPKTFIKFEDVIQISAKNSQNTDFLKSRLRELMDRMADEELRSDDEEGSEDGVGRKQMDILKASKTEHIGLKAV